MDGSVPARIRSMAKILKSAMLWQMLGGFVLGTAGILSAQPADATHMLAQHLSALIG